jgi:hypothetical protein
MSRTTYRLFDGTTRVSTAVELKDGSILMVYPRMENFADTNLWKWVMEHEAEYTNSSLTLSTHKTKLSAAQGSKPCAPQPLSPYTPPKEPVAAPDPMRLGPSREGISFEELMAPIKAPRIYVTPPVSPRAPFQEPIAASLVSAPSGLGPSAEGLGFDPDEKTRIYMDLTDIHQELAGLSRTMNERLSLMDTRIKALLKKLD